MAEGTKGSSSGSSDTTQKTYRFLERIRGQRKILSLTAEEVLSLVRTKGLSPNFNLQEYFQGSDSGRVYYDWDAKFDSHPGEETLADHFRQFKELVRKLHPGEPVHFASRHGWVTVTVGKNDGKEKATEEKGKGKGNAKEKGKETIRKYKGSFRAWCDLLEAEELADIPTRAREVLGLKPRENHPFLDLSVYKSREQLLGFLFATKDTDAEVRYLTPIDDDGVPLSCAHPEVTWDLLRMYLVQEPVAGGKKMPRPAQAAASGSGKGKGKSKGGKSSAAETEDESAGSAGANGVEVFTSTNAEANSALNAASDFFGERYRMQEQLDTIHVHRAERYLIIPTRKKWCLIKRGTHAGNNPYIVVTEAGSRFKCPDEDCKAAGDLPVIPFAQLPVTLREFFNKALYGRVDEGLMSDARVECTQNITDNFPEEDDVQVEPYRDMLTALAKHQKCRKCRSGSMQFEHTLRGWHLRCTDCHTPWPTTPVSLSEAEFPKIFAVLTQLNVNIGNLTVQNNTVNNYITAEEPFVGTYEQDGLDFFPSDPECNKLFLASLKGTDAALASFVFYLYKEEFHCAKSGSKGTDWQWYQFRNHRWNGKAELTLRTRLGKEGFVRWFIRAAQHYEFGLQTEDTKRKARHIKRVCEQLEDGARRKRILEDAVELFHEYRPDFLEVLDTANKLVFTNGVFDFDTMSFNDGKPEDYMSMQLKIPYHPVDETSADYQFVMSFMSAIQPDEATRDYLLTVLSLCLTTNTKLQQFWILTGEGANGKSKLMNFLMEALGDYFGTAPAALLTRRREDANQANESLSALERVRIAVFSEGSSAEVLQVNTMKLFSGEDLISTRGLHEKQKRWRAAFKCFLVCNDIPNLDDSSWAAWRRLMVIHFPTSFVDNPIRPHEREKDPDVGEKLSRCTVTFIGILIEYFRGFLLRGVRVPHAVAAATQKYQTENDIFKEFRDQYILDEHGSFMKWKDLSPAFSAWARGQGYRIPAKVTQLKAMAERSLSPMYSNHWNGGPWVTGWANKRLLPSNRNENN